MAAPFSLSQGSKLVKSIKIVPNLSDVSCTMLELFTAATQLASNQLRLIKLFHVDDLCDYRQFLSARVKKIYIFAQHPSFLN